MFNFPTSVVLQGCFFVYLVFERLLHRTGPSYDGPARCSSRLPKFSQFVLAEGDGRWSIG